jgi:hypothetical protein
VRPPVSPQKLLVDEGGTDTVVYRAPHGDYFHTDTKVFPAVQFLVEVLQHLPDPRFRLIRSYGLYSPRARGTPGPTGALARREGGPAALTSPASLPRAGSATIHPNLPSGSVSRRAAIRPLSVGQAEARRMGSTDQESLRGGSPELPPLSETYEGPRPHH